MDFPLESLTSYYAGSRKSKPMPLYSGSNKFDQITPILTLYHSKKHQELEHFSFPRKNWHVSCSFSDVFVYVVGYFVMFLICSCPSKKVLESSKVFWQFLPNTLIQGLKHKCEVPTVKNQDKN